MSVELTKDLLKMEQSAGNGYAQALVEGDILVPDTKPDISRILSVDGAVDITNKEASDNKMVVNGVVNFKILYVADGGEYPVYGMDASATFTQNIDIPKAEKGTKSDVKAEIEHIEFDKLNERKIGIKAVVNLLGKSRTIFEVDALREIQGIDNLQVLRESVSYQERIQTVQSETIVRESFELSQDMPEIKEIVQCNVNATVKEKEVMDGKIALSGLLKTNVIYVADDDDYSLRFLKYEIPFTHFIEHEQVQRDMDVELGLKISDVYTDVKNNVDEERKVLDLEADVQIEATLNRMEQKEFIVDAYSPSCSLSLETKKIALDQIIGKNSSNTMIKETLEVPSGKRNIDKIFSLNGKVFLTDSMLSDGKNHIEGVAAVTVLYMPPGKDVEAQSFSQEIPFRHTLDIEGATSDMEVETELYIDDIDYNLINPDQLEVRLNIGASSTVKKKVEKEILINVEDTGERIDISKKPSITIYFIQPGDTLWKIAKRYHTTVEELMNANEIEDPNRLVPGERLFIQKNVYHQF